MTEPPNIYPLVAFDLHPKVKTFVDRLNREGQIDCDRNGYPWLVRIERQGPRNILVRIVRNRTLETFLMDPRKPTAEPILRWNRADGYVRSGGKQVIDVSGEQPRGERAKRTMERYIRLMEQII